MFLVHGLAYSSYVYYIPIAWASALLILLDWACESLYTRDKQKILTRALFYVLFGQRKLNV